MCGLIGLFSLILVVLEIRLMGVVSSRLGGMNMLLLIFITGWLGLQLIRIQQHKSAQLQAQLMQGQLDNPLLIAESMVKMFGGFLLLIPGPVSDVTGMILQLPGVALIVARLIGNRIKLGPTFGGGQSPFGGAQSPFGGYSPFEQSPQDDEPSYTQYRSKKSKRTQSGHTPSDQIIEVEGRVVDKKD